MARRLALAFTSSPWHSDPCADVVASGCLGLAPRNTASVVRGIDADTGRS